jgi:hypothetical protein
MADKDRTRRAAERRDEERRDEERRDDEGRATDRAGVMMREAAEAAHARILDDPDLPEQPSGARHVVYFASILIFAFVLNLLVLVAIAR